MGRQRRSRSSSSLPSEESFVQAAGRVGEARRALCRPHRPRSGLSINCFAPPVSCISPVGEGGLEPPASCSQSRCATNCATPRGLSIAHSTSYFLFLVVPPQSVRWFYLRPCRGRSSAQHLRPHGQSGRGRRADYDAPCQGGTPAERRHGRAGHPSLFHRRSCRRARNPKVH